MEVSLPGGRVRYAYDPLGRRIGRTWTAAAGGEPEARRYCYSSWSPIEERDGADRVVSSCVYGAGIDEVLTMRRGSATTGSTPTTRAASSP